MNSSSTRLELQQIGSLACVARKSLREIVESAYEGAKGAPTEEEVLAATADAFWNRFAPVVVPEPHQRKPLDINAKIALLALIVTILQTLIALNEEAVCLRKTYRRSSRKRLNKLSTSTHLLVPILDPTNRKASADARYWR